MPTGSETAVKVAEIGNVIRDILADLIKKVQLTDAINQLNQSVHASILDKTISDGGALEKALSEVLATSDPQNGYRLANALQTLKETVERSARSSTDSDSIKNFIITLDKVASRLVITDSMQMIKEKLLHLMADVASVIIIANSEEIQNLDAGLDKLYEYLDNYPKVDNEQLAEQMKDVMTCLEAIKL